MKKIVIAGGDKRMSCLAELLFNSGYSFASYAVNGGLTKDEFLCYLRGNNNILLILPLPVSRDKIHLNTGKAFENVRLSEIGECLGKSDTVAGGIIGDSSTVLSANGTKVYDYYDEEFITDNARLTAQCLKFVLNENGIYDFSGRTAKAIAEFMKENGAKVLITARDPHALADAVKKGYSICLLRDYDCIAHDADILINTVPAEIIDKNILSRLRKDVLLIDIASPPFGVDIGLADSYGINAVRALGLPGKYAPEEAGRLIFKKAQPLKSDGFNVVPIMSETAFTTDTRFGSAKDFAYEITEITGNDIISTLPKAEPIGPKKLLDLLIIAPTTGNTLGKMANGITDTTVTLAAKAHLRNRRPVVIAVSTNDALGATAKNIGLLMNCKYIYFVPMRQDDCINKPNSIVADFEKIPITVLDALNGKQTEPVIIS